MNKDMSVMEICGYLTVEQLVQWLIIQNPNDYLSSMLINMEIEIKQER